MKLSSLSGIGVTAMSRPQDVVTLNGESHIVHGTKKEISGWATIIDAGVIPASLLGATVKIEIKLTVVAVTGNSNEPWSMVLKLVGNSSDFVVHSFLEKTNDPFMDGIDTILLEETEREREKNCKKSKKIPKKEPHRFTGFMDYEKEL